MVLDPIDAAAKALTADEARILAHYASNENAADIAITLEMDRNVVIRVIREKGRDNRQFCRRVATAFQQRNRDSSRLGVLLSSDVIGGPVRSVGLGGLPAALRAGPPAAAAATRTVARTVAAATAPRKAAPKKATPPAPPPAPESPAQAEPEPPVQQEQEEEQNVQLVDAPTTAPARAEDLPLAAEHMAPDHNMFRCQHPDCRRDAAALGPEPDAKPEPEPAAVPAGGETFEQLLARAERCGNEDVQHVARNLRADLAALVEALDTVGRAALLEERIAVLDQQIEEKVSVRDKLRAELEELMGSGVMVSVASGHLRKPVVGDPDDATLRAWGTRNGYELSRVGKVPGAVLIAYRKAHGLAA